ncbi:MAG: ATP-binding protein [Thermodesulfobacteriota bacterium]|nr:ATP-binding protein [Thermodesulfobacteriota bacterium]
MKDSQQERKRAKAKVKWLILFRLAMVSFLLGLVVIIQFKTPGSLPPQSIHAIYIIVTLTYLLSMLYIFLLKLLKNILVSVYIQCFFDTLLVTALVYTTGGSESVYSTLYPLLIIYSVLFLGKRGGLLVASVVSIMYGLLLDFEFYGIIHPIHGWVHQYNAEAGYILLRICIHISSFYTVALLMSFVVEREQKTKTLLSEKESAFDQLDILHRNIIESVGAGIITIDPRGRIKSFNRAAERITGISPYDVRDRVVGDIFPDCSGMGDKINEIERNPNPSSRRFEIVLSPGAGGIILGFSIYPLIDLDGRSIGYTLIFQDLTSVKKMEREIEKNRKMVLMGEMSAALAHELRSPLASISGSIKLLTEDLKLEGSNRKLMEIILMGKDQMENLVKDFLLFARPDTHNRCEIDVASIMGEVLESVRLSPEWNEKIEIITHLCGQNKICGNSIEIRQTLWNIILNALQAMSDGGTLEIKTRLDVDEDNHDFLEISVRDTGCGIEAKHMHNVREPFYTRKEKGTGLGLAVVNRIVEIHGGTLRIESKPGIGTRCMVRLPVAG